LGVLPGDDQSTAYGANASGAVVGASFGQGTPRAFYWEPNSQTMHDLTTPGASGHAFAVSSGPITYAVGNEISSDGSHAVIWIGPPSAAVRLDDSFSTADGVNDSGTVVGSFRGRAAIWSWDGSAYQRVDVERLSGHVEAYATAIDEDGIVVGYGYADGTFYRGGFLRRLHGAVVALPPMAGDVESHAAAVSDVFVDGEDEFVNVVGASIDADGTERGVRWVVDVGTGEVSPPEGLSMQFASVVRMETSPVRRSRRTVPSRSQ
jgi:probable HAF family extracellular repeat protein